MTKKDIMGYGKLGAILGVATPYVLKGVSTLLNYIPGLNVNLQSVSVATTGVGTTVGTGLGVYAQKIVGLVPIGFSLPTLLVSLIGGALFMVLGAYIYNSIKMIQFAKSRVGKLTEIIVLASIASGIILSMSLAIPSLVTIIELVINAFVLSYLAVLVDKNVYKIIP
jgi:hypothetical protein